MREVLNLKVNRRIFTKLFCRDNSQFGEKNKYFGFDPTIIRPAWVLFCPAGGSGILAYIICAIVIPPRTGLNVTRVRKEKK